MTTAVRNIATAASDGGEGNWDEEWQCDAAKADSSSPSSATRNDAEEIGRQCCPGYVGSRDIMGLPVILPCWAGSSVAARCSKPRQD